MGVTIPSIEQPEKELNNLFLLTAIFVVGTSLAIHGYQIYLTWLSPLGYYDFLLGCLLPMPSICIIVVLPFAVLGAFIKRFRRQSLNNFLILAIAYLSIGFTCNLIEDSIQLKRFETLISENDQVVNAILAYEQETGHLPTSLQDLQPGYLPSKYWIFTKGLHRDDISVDYTYNGTSYRQEFQPLTWILHLAIPVGWVGLDYAYFIYTPEQNYRDDLDRVGDWAFWFSS